jgi:hypothetical protein
MLLASVAIVTFGSLASEAETITTTTTTVTTTTSGSENQVRASTVANKNRHCVMSLSQPDNLPVCFDTFTEAMATVTKGKITDAPADVRQAMRSQAFLNKMNPSGTKKIVDIKDKGASTPPASSNERIDVHVLTIWCDNNFTGCTFGDGSLSFSGPPCDDTLFTEPPEKTIPSMPSGWNDDFESFAGANECFAQVFEHTNFIGASLPFASRRGDLGVLNDQVSSIILQ